MNIFRTVTGIVYLCYFIYTMYTYTGDTTGATIGAGTTYPSATPKFNLYFCT